MTARSWRPRTAVGSAGIMSLIDQYRDGHRGANNAVDAIESLLLGKAPVKPARDAKGKSGKMDAEKLQEKNAMIADLDVKSKRKDAEIKSLQTKLTEANAKLESMKNSKKQNIASAMEGGSAEQLQAALAECQSLLKESENRVNSLTAENKSTQNELKKVHGDKDAASAALKKAQVDLETEKNKAGKKSTVCKVM